MKWKISSLVFSDIVILWIMVLGACSPPRSAIIELVHNHFWFNFPFNCDSGAISASEQRFAADENLQRKVLCSLNIWFYFGCLVNLTTPNVPFVSKFYNWSWRKKIIKKLVSPDFHLFNIGGLCHISEFNYVRQKSRSTYFHSWDVVVWHKRQLTLVDPYFR